MSQTSQRTLVASASSIVERFPVSQGKLRRDGTPLRQLDGCGSTRQRDRKARDWYTLHSRRAWKGPRFFRRGAVAVPCLFAIRGVPRTHQEALLHNKGGRFPCPMVCRASFRWCVAKPLRKRFKNPLL